MFLVLTRLKAYIKRYTRAQITFNAVANDAQLLSLPNYAITLPFSRKYQVSEKACNDNVLLSRSELIEAYKTVISGNQPPIGYNKDSFWRLKLTVEEQLDLCAFLEAFAVQEYHSSNHLPKREYWSNWAWYFRTGRARLLKGAAQEVISYSLIVEREPQSAYVV